jgi:hypothetical protein
MLILGVAKINVTVQSSVYYNKDKWKETQNIWTQFRQIHSKLTIQLPNSSTNLGINHILCLIAIVPTVFASIVVCYSLSFVATAMLS